MGGFGCCGEGGAPRRRGSGAQAPGWPAGGAHSPRRGKLRPPRAAAVARPPPPGRPPFFDTSLGRLRILPCLEAAPSLSLSRAGASRLVPHLSPRGQGPRRARPGDRGGGGGGKKERGLRKPGRLIAERLVSAGAAGLPSPRPIAACSYSTFIPLNSETLSTLEVGAISGPGHSRPPMGPIAADRLPEIASLRRADSDRCRGGGAHRVAGVGRACG